MDDRRTEVGHTHGSAHSRVLPTTAQCDSAAPPPKLLRNCPPIIEDAVTILWTPTDNKTVAADICFVHGLMGYPRQTWQYGTPAKYEEAEAHTKESKKKTGNRLSRIFASKSVKEASEKSLQGPSDENGCTINKTDCFWPLDLVPDDFPDVSHDLRLRLSPYIFLQRQDESDDHKPTRLETPRSTHEHPS